MTTHSICLNLVANIKIALLDKYPTIENITITIALYRRSCIFRLQHSLERLQGKLLQRNLTISVV